jgi:hypothetical protein
MILPQKFQFEAHMFEPKLWQKLTAKTPRKKVSFKKYRVFPAKMLNNHRGKS